MADNIVTYDNFVLENKATDIVNTQLNVNSLYTLDDSLTLSAGLKKIINKYTYTGTVEKLAKGAKNTVKGSISFTPTEYEVSRYQQTFVYNDMDAMKDPYSVDSGIKCMADVMANEIRTEYFTELGKISKKFEYTTFNYDAVVDALAEINLEVEDGLFIVMGNDLRATIRKDGDYKAAKQGEILYTGQFGTISGVPVCFSKLCPAGVAYITNKEAVKFFVKKHGSIEQDRDIETKDNTVVYERHGVMALVDESKSIKMSKKAG